MTAPRRALEDFDDELARLVERLQETQQQILALTNGLVDAVMPASGNLLLLPETQTHFRDQALAYQAFAAEQPAILDALPAHVALLSATGEVRAINAVWLAFAQTLSKGPGLAVGENYFDFWKPGAIFGGVDVASVASGVKAVLSREQSQFAAEYRIEGLASRPWFRLIVAPLAESAEKGAVVMHVDITDQKANEEQIRQMQRLDALGQLTGGVAHDFNNLLMVIMGNGEALLASLEHDEERRGSAELIVMASERGAALTNRLLAFARRQTLAPQAIDLRELLAGIEMLLRRTIGENVRIVLPTGIESHSVLADRSQLENAVINLCLNARDAMPKGGAVTMGLEAVDVTAMDMPGKPDLPPGRYVALTVSDTGCGMDAATLARALEPFFTTKPAGKGSGLGLSVVFGFIKQSGGNVSIASTPDVGTAVRLWLPRADIVVSPEPPPGRPTRQVPTIVFCSSKMTTWSGGPSAVSSAISATGWLVWRTPQRPSPRSAAMTVSTCCLPISSWPATWMV
ncbi:PAS domain-containing protein [Rhizobium sp. G21]|nr:PAS domain-containing protein [Rhizobium sp. G21]